MAMKKRRLGRQRPRGLRARTRLHGHVRVLRPARRRRVDRDASTARSSSASNFLDTADIYGPFTNEELVGQAICSGKRDASCSPPSSASCAARTARSAASTAGPTTCARPRGSPAPARRRHDRPLLPAPRRSQRRRSRTRSARWPSWCRPARCAISACPRPRRRRIRRAHKVHPITALQSEYSLWSRDPEDDILADLPRARHRLRRLQPARPRLPDRPDQELEDLAGRRLAGACSRASRARTSTRTSRWCDRIEEIAAKRAASRRRSSRWPGCSPRATTSSPSPAPSAEVPRGERSPPSRRAHSATTSARIETAAPKGVAAGERYPEVGRALIDR